MFKTTLKAMSLLFAVALFSGAANAGVVTYTDAFPSGDTTVVGSTGYISADKGYGYFWSVARGDMVSETFTGTGIENLNQVDLDLNIAHNSLAVAINWDVYVNGILVGDWSIDGSFGTGMLDLSFSFADIAGAGAYEIAMFVTNEVYPGGGSVSLGLDTELVLTGTDSTIPEPAIIALLGLGLVGLGATTRKRQ